MKKTSHIFKTLLLLLCSLTLCSCLSINRNIKLNKDGSGQETMKITFLKEFYEMMSSMTTFMDSSRQQGYLDSLYSDEVFISKTKSEYDSIPGVKIIDISSSRNSDSSNTFTIKYDFDNIKSIGSSLSGLNNNEDNKDNAQTLVTWIKDGTNVLFSYNYEESSPKDSMSNDSLTEQMKNGMSEMFGGGSMHFEIEFPYEVVSSNATSADGKKLAWNFSMADLLTKGKMNLEAVMKED